MQVLVNDDDDDDDDRRSWCTLICISALWRPYTNVRVHWKIKAEFTYKVCFL